MSGLVADKHLSECSSSFVLFQCVRGNVWCTGNHLESAGCETVNSCCARECTACSG